jgi:hypothetical protein
MIPEFFMGIKLRGNYPGWVVLAVLFLLPVLLWAQDEAKFPAQDSGFFFDEDNVFYQRLSWSGSEFIYQYEVLIEKEDNDEYQGFQRDFTFDTFIEVSLPSGNYRFCVIPYNYLLQPDESSDWMYIEILPAYNPKLVVVSPLIHLYDSVYGLSFSFTDIEPAAEIFLITPDGSVIKPVRFEYNRQEGFAGLLFYIPGSTFNVYELFIRNPGGLETSMSGILVLHSEPEPEPEPEPVFEIFFLTNRHGPFPLYFSQTLGFIIPVHGSDFGSKIGFPNFAFRFGMFYSNPDSISPGLEFSASLMIHNGIESGYQNTIELNVLFQKWNIDKLSAFTIFYGPGVNILPSGDGSENRFFFNFGISYLRTPHRNFFFDIGICYSIMLTGNSSGIIRPWIGIGLYP